ncbi:Small GTP-binding protein domain [Trinorchestia longiramus]|nr:Small GTP-binding protein domain [Trinorchestia longiramus]
MSRGLENFKVVLLGEGCVGKTSLVLRYVEDKFNEKHISTIQASFLMKKISIDGKRLQLSIWDTAGQERFHALGPIYYRDSQGAILVYDITDMDSYHKVQDWVRELRRMQGETIVLAIAGNKSDLSAHRVVDCTTAEQYAEEVGAIHFETSARLNEGVEELFLDLSRRMLANAAQQQQQQQQQGSTGGLQLSDDPDQSSTSKRSCC